LSRKLYAICAVTVNSKWARITRAGPHKRMRARYLDAISVRADI
jgi:hypothetical protein